jgi:tetratricopeptide (TPR) repeat protein
MVFSIRPFRSVLISFTITLCAASWTGCATTGAHKGDKDFIAQGNQYARDGLLREAAEEYRKALVQNPGNATANRNLGMVLVKTGDYKGAVTYLEKSLTKFSVDYDANFYLGEAYRALDQYADAIFRYKMALKLRPNEIRPLKALAWSFFKIRYYSEALSTAKKLVARAPADEQAAIILARTLLKVKRSGEALATLQNATNRAPKQAKPYLKSVEGDIYYETGDKKKAAEAYKLALKDQPMLAGALLGMGKCLADEGNNPKAISFMERAVRVRPNLTEAHYLLGRAYEKSDPGKSVRYYQNFRKQAATDPEYLGQLDEVKERVVFLKNNSNATNSNSTSK